MLSDLIILGEGSVYSNGEKVGEFKNAWATLKSGSLSKYFKSVKLNGEEILDDEKGRNNSLYYNRW